jgi:predicted NAD-dependent protein-ADP-ribosyltransferase YbiA (DUF1768 family)
MFGGFPTQESVVILEDIGVTHFVDLTCIGEKRITPYLCKGYYLRYPIQDHKVPCNKRTFANFIIKISSIISELKGKDKIYIHCKGGHGRSGLVVACLLCYIHNIGPGEAITRTTKYHGTRPMREKWRRMGSPQTRSQKTFVSKFFEPIEIGNYIQEKTSSVSSSVGSLSNYLSTGFSNDSTFGVSLHGLGTFKTASAAFYALSNPSHSNYVKCLESATNKDEIRKLFVEEPRRDDWEVIKYKAMDMVITTKLQQHDVLMNALMDTGLGCINMQGDSCWDYPSHDGSPSNKLGYMLTKIREENYKLVYKGVEVPKGRINVISRPISRSSPVFKKTRSLSNNRPRRNNFKQWNCK